MYASNQSLVRQMENIKEKRRISDTESTGNIEIL